MRDLYMKTGQGFLLVFSITSQSSLNELAGLREEIIRIKDDENVPMVIVGNKADLEESRMVQRAKGFSMSQRWGAPYYESSARTRSRSTVSAADACCADAASQQTSRRCLSTSVDRCSARTTSTTQLTRRRTADSGLKASAAPDASAG